LLEWSWLQLVDMDQARGGPLRRLAGFLEELPATTNSAVLSEKLADLNEDLGKPASAIDYYEQALKLNPSLQQRIRLRLTLGTDLTTQNRAAEAADDYRQLLREAPDYPDKAKIEDLLVQLEPKLARPPR
jgi:tetratricopeptide (TPR) repeat protein